ncbi:MAG TPA: retropepsin-like aspartic protease [Candidatus Binatia bacterium]|nr:retropepsin-like aspartic protease [Candidatus Binatia bacterium]
MWAKFLSGFFLFFFYWPNHGPSANEFFRWFDEKGTIHFADHPQSIPERYRNQSPKHQGTLFRDAALIAPVSRIEQAQVADPQKVLVNLTRDDGRLLVNGTVNHHNFVRFIVDTGASMTMVPASVASRLGLDTKRALLMEVRGIGGVIEGRLVEIDSLRVGNAEARNFDVVVIEDGLRGMGLLGADFLSRYQLDINYTREQMVLHQGEGSYDGYPAAWWQEKFRLYRRLKRTYEQRIKQNEDHLRSLGINPAQRSSAGGYTGKVNPLRPIWDEIKAYETYLALLERKIGDLQFRANRAELPRHLRD